MSIHRDDFPALNLMVDYGALTKASQGGARLGPPQRGDAFGVVLDTPWTERKLAIKRLRRSLFGAAAKVRPGDQLFSRYPVWNSHQHTPLITTISPATTATPTASEPSTTPVKP